MMMHNTVEGWRPRPRCHSQVNYHYHFYQYQFVDHYQYQYYIFYYYQYHYHVHLPTPSPNFNRMEDFGAGYSRHNYPSIPPPPGLPIRLNAPMMRLHAYQQYQGASVNRPLGSYPPSGMPLYYNSPRYNHQRSESLYPYYRHFQPPPAAGRGTPYITSSGTLGYHHLPPARNNLGAHAEQGGDGYRVSAEKSAKLSSWLGIDSPYHQGETSNSKYAPKSSYEGRGNQGMKPRAPSYEPQPQPQQSAAAIAQQKQQQQQQQRQRLIQQYDLDFPNLLSTVATKVGKKKQRAASAKIPIESLHCNESPFHSNEEENTPYSSSSFSSNLNLDNDYQTPSQSVKQCRNENISIEDGNVNEPSVDADILRRQHLDQSYLREYAPTQAQSDNGQASSNRKSRFNYGTSGIDAARMGYNQFCMDFGEECDETWVKPKLEKPIPPKRDFHGELPTFDVDDKIMEDLRQIVNYTRPGQKNFKTFNEGWQRDLLRSVFNVNQIDYCNPKEICSRRISQKSIKCWPVDVLGSDQSKKEEWKKNINESIGRWITNDDAMAAPSVPRNYTLNKFSAAAYSAFGDGAAYWDGDGVGPYGVKSLAKCVFSDEGMRDNPMGYVTFMGMNLEKVFKDIDKSEPIVATFAGPLAEHSHTLDFSSVEVYNPFEEYNVPYNANWTKEEIEKWTKNVTLTKVRSILFTFETLMFVFYSCVRDRLQLWSITELHQRGWRFHKIFQVWMAPYIEDRFSNGDNPRGVIGLSHKDSTKIWKTGVYIFFNYLKWDFFKAEFKISPGILTSEAETLMWAKPSWYH